MKRPSLLALFVPQPGRYATTVLMILNLAVFALMVLSGLGFMTFSSEALLAWGANYRPYLEGAGALRLLLSTFLHGGLLHLFMNMYGLLIIGTLLEPGLGARRFAIAYLLSGVAGSIGSALFYPATVSVGASGAIFGMFGMLLILLMRRDPRVANLPRRLLRSLLVLVAINLVIGLLVPGIDNAAHVGGFVVGALLGLVTSLQRRISEQR